MVSSRFVLFEERDSNQITTTQRLTKNIGSQGVTRTEETHLYSTEVEVDEDALEEYWVNIRRKPELKALKRFTALSKY